MCLKITCCTPWICAPTIGRCGRKPQTLHNTTKPILAALSACAQILGTGCVRQGSGSVNGMALRNSSSHFPIAVWPESQEYCGCSSPLPTDGSNFAAHSIRDILLAVAFAWHHFFCQWDLRGQSISLLSWRFGRDH